MTWAVWEAAVDTVVIVVVEQMAMVCGAEVAMAVEKVAVEAGSMAEEVVAAAVVARKVECLVEDREAAMVANRVEERVAVEMEMEVEVEVHQDWAADAARVCWVEMGVVKMVAAGMEVGVEVVVHQGEVAVVSAGMAAVDTVAGLEESEAAAVSPEEDEAAVIAVAVAGEAAALEAAAAGLGEEDLMVAVMLEVSLAAGVTAGEEEVWRVAAVLEVSMAAGATAREEVVAAAVATSEAEVAMAVAEGVAAPEADAAVVEAVDVVIPVAAVSGAVTTVVVGVGEVTAMEEGAGVAALAVPEDASEEEGLEGGLVVEAMAAAARAREATAWGAEGATG